MTVTVKHAKTNAIPNWTQAQLDEQIALGNFAEGTVLADIVLPSDWNNDHTFTGTLDVSNGGTGATTLTGYVKGSGTSALTASSTIPNTDISGLGTISTQNANNVSITGGSVNGTTIGATTASTGKFTSVTTPSVTATTDNLTLSAISTGAVVFNTLNGTGLRLSELAGGTVTTGLGIYSGTASQNSVYISPHGSGSNSNLLISSKGVGNLHLQTNTNNNTSGTTQALVANTASAVNYVQVTGAATGGGVTVSAQGSDSNVSLTLRSKGSNEVTLGNGNTFRIFSALGASGTNYPQTTSSATGQAIQFASAGSDTNISMAFQPKGTGAIDLAAGSSGVNISNGGTVTAITRTAAGTGYTSLPTMTISAPTTAGGVQATATYTMGLAGVPTITSGGTGYTVGDTLTFVGGTGGVATLTVSTVSAGVITGVTVGSFGTYTALPTNPISVTGGTGSSATFTATWAINSVFTITNAGSGYIEQPTVTFSGGGGSGASAFAFIGSAPTVKALGGSQLNIATAGGTNFAVSDSGLLNPTTYAYATGGSGSAGIGIISGNANAGFTFTSKGTSAIDFYTNNYGSLNLKVSHTASAVNYVQVTGATTTNPPAITAQGSDANIPLAIASKGTSGVRLQTAGSTSQAIINHIASAVNQIGISGNIAGSAPSLSAQGSDTNIDLALTPKGTGVVQFGTYTGTILTPTGYVTIKTSDGTTRRLLVG